MEEDDDDDDDDDDEGRVPRAAERRKVRSGRERVDVSSRGVMYCMTGQLTTMRGYYDVIVENLCGL